MPARIWMALLVATALAGAVACNNSKSGSDGFALPTLAGTPIPTVTVVPTPTIDCEAPAAGTIPANFPSDIPVPPDAIVDSIETAPYLRIVLRVTPPVTADGRQPYAILGGAYIDQIRALGWKGLINLKADGSDWDFTKDDGRRGHFSAIPYAGCPAIAKLTLDLRWITP